MTKNKPQFRDIADIKETPSLKQVPTPKPKEPEDFQGRYRVFVARREQDIECQLTVMDTHTGKPVTGLEKLGCRSGQPGFSGYKPFRLWRRGYSPIPFTQAPHPDLKKYTAPNLIISLSGSPFQPKQYDAGRAGIGEFWRVGSTNQDPATTYSYRRNLKRLALGIHPENEYVGSRGCVVIKDRQDFVKLSDFLWMLKDAKIEEVELNVIPGNF